MSNKAKELIFEEEARQLLYKGIKELTDIVGVTLGPKGRHVGLDTGFGSPKITNDGTSIAQEVELQNQYANMGASIGKEVATKMKEKCGDGTTTSILLLGSLVEQGVKNIASGASPISIKRGLEKATQALLIELEKNATHIQSNEDIEKLAIAAASGSEEIGKMIAQAFAKVGKQSVISIEEAKGIETTLEIVEGMQFERGYTSAYFVTNPEAMTCQMDKPRILITDKRLSSVQEILNLLKVISSSAEELLIIADDVEGEALSTLVINRLRGTLKVCAVKAPGFGDSRKAILQDLAVLTQATLISEEVGLQLKDADLSMLGSAEKVVVTKESTTIVNGQGLPSAIQKRILQIACEIDNCASSYDLEKLQERKAKLSGGVAVIRVGAMTESELKQKKQVFEDSLNSTRAALEEGVLVGGGIALLRASKDLQKKLTLPKEEQIGMQILLEACTAPFKRLVKNSGFDSSIFLEEILHQPAHFGFNVQTGKVEDLFKAGVKDALKIVKHALQFAGSAASIVLLTECLVGEAPEDA